MSLTAVVLFYRRFVASLCATFSCKGCEQASLYQRKHCNGMISISIYERTGEALLHATQGVRRLTEPMKWRCVR